MSAADILRKAAELVEQRAAAAAPGPWVRERHEWSHPNVAWFVKASNLTSDSRTGVAHATDEDSAWIALASPAVAGPLAAWLRAEADLAVSLDHRPDPIAAMLAIGQARLRMYADGNPPALALARAILGEVS